MEGIVKLARPIRSVKAEKHDVTCARGARGTGMRKEYQNAPLQLPTPIEEGFGKPSFFARFLQFPRVLF